MKPILMIVAVVGLMAVAAFFLTTHVVKPMFAPGGVAEDAEDHSEKAEKEESQDEEAGGGEVYLVSDLLVNPTGTGGTRYLSATVGLEVKSPEAALELEERNIQVRDVLISILSARSVDQLTDYHAREQMRGEILKRLNTMLGAQELAAVYFVDYVLQ